MESYVGQLLLVGFNFAPVNWALCQGQLLPISEYEALYNLIGTTYGGDGQSTFGLPDLRGRVPLHMGQLRGGQNYVLGELAGVESVSLHTQNLPSHNHPLAATGQGNSNQAQGNLLAAPPTGTGNTYVVAAPALVMDPRSITPSGGGNQPHDNMQPYLVLNWAISLYGIYPSQG